MHKISPQAMAMACGLLWGGGLLSAGLANLAAPRYGEAFLQGVGSVYPGVHRSRTVKNALVGAAYGFVDGAAAGLLLAWLYNWFQKRVA
jgi:hypothetical protein